MGRIILTLMPFRMKTRISSVASHSKSRASLASGVFLALVVLLFSDGRLSATQPVTQRAGGLVALPKRIVTAVELENAGFEDGIVGWTGGVEGTFSVDKSSSRSRSTSLRIDVGKTTKWTPSVRQSLPDVKPGQYRLAFWVKTRGLEVSKGKANGVRVSVEYIGTDGKRRRKPTKVFSGEHDWQRVELVVPLPESLKEGSASISIHRYGGRLDGEAWFDDFRLERLETPPVEAFLCWPNFRCFLPADGPQKVRVWVRVNDSATLETPVLKVYDHKGQLIASKSLTHLDSCNMAELDASEWPVGEYRLEVSLDDYRYPPYVIQKIQPEDANRLAVRFTKDNVLILRGQPIFPLGLYTTSGYSNSPQSYISGQLKKMSEAPINFLINYWQTGAPVSAQRAYLVAQREWGINYLATVNNFYPGKYKVTSLQRTLAPELTGAIESQGDMDRFVSSYAQRMSGAANLAGYYAMDERPIDDVPRHFHQYQVLRQADPDHLTFGVSNRVGELTAWRDTVDVLGMDPYPLFNMKLDTPLTLVGRQTRATIEATQGSRPVWMVLQFFQGWSKDRWPTEEELRTMSLMAITEGARGLFYWSYGARALAWVKDPEKKEEYWQRLVRVTKELKSLEPALLAPDAPELISEVSDPAVRWCAREADGKWYVFAYRPAERFSDRLNGSPKEVTFRFRDGRLVRKSFLPDTAEWFVVDKKPNNL